HYSFFFSSRRRHTRFSRDWSSDVCSSDLNTDRTAPVHLFQVAFTHHAPAVGRARQLKGQPFADHRNMAVIGIPGVAHKQVAAMGDGFTYARVQLAGGRVGKTQLQFGMLFYPHRAPARVYALFQVFTMTEGAVFKARTRQRRARLN